MIFLFYFYLFSKIGSNKFFEFFFKLILFFNSFGFLEKLSAKY